MHIPHPAILIILLLIPNTTWRDWQAADAPHLRQLFQSGSIALMNSRTAESDKTTEAAGIRTIVAGARMYATADAKALEYPAVDGNLTKSLAKAGVTLVSSDRIVWQLLGIGPVQAESSRVLDVEIARGDMRGVDDAVQGAESVTEANGGTLIVISPNPSPTEYKSFDQLTPVVIWRQNTPPGLIYSPSTHQAGLITNTDIAPTIASAMDVPLSGPVYGSPVELKPVAVPNDRWAILADIDRRSIEQSTNQVYVPWIALGLAALIVVLNLMLLAGRGIVVSGLAAGAGCACAAMLAGSSTVGFAELAVGVLFISFIASGKSPQAAKTWNAILTVAALALLLADATIGHCAISAGSLLGYPAAEGARYYGLGNEDMGVLIGATTVVSILLLDFRAGQPAGIALWLLVAGILGVPTIGAKAGGLIVALIGLAGYVASGVANPRFPKRVIVIAAACAAIVVGVAALIAMGRFGGSHVSQTMAQAHTFGSAVLWSVAERKAAMDAHLVFHSAWMLVLLACVIGAALIVRTATGNRFTIGQNRRLLLTGAVSTLACLVFNDAGVVAAALCSAILWSRIAVLALTPDIPSAAGASDARIGDDRRYETEAASGTPDV